jgi:hypothetical protein
LGVIFAIAALILLGHRRELVVDDEDRVLAHGHAEVAARAVSM